MLLLVQGQLSRWLPCRVVDAVDPYDRSLVLLLDRYIIHSVLALRV
jgi:hypothetical protein